MSRSSSPGSPLPGPGPVATRRGALGLLGATCLVLSGCDVSDLDPRADSTPRSAAPDLERPATRDAEADLASVRRAVRLIASCTALAEAARTRHPALATSLEPLVGVHRRHQAMLEDALPGEQSSAPEPTAQARPKPGPALTAVRDREQAAVRELADLAVAARSGALARLLASMAAALSQQLTVLPRTPPAPTPAPSTGGGP